MINTSSEYKEVINGQDRTFYTGAHVTLADGTEFDLDNERIKTLSIEDATSQNGVFTIGSAIVNELTLMFSNIDDKYSDYDFTGAIIRPTVGLQLSESIETLNKGVFTADNPKVKSTVISLTALDNMVKFDKPFKGVLIPFPCTHYELLDAVCTYCGVTLATNEILNGDMIIQSRPVDDATNCREVISWIAQDSGNFARISTSGQLELKWYDFEVFEEEAHVDGGMFDSTTESSYQSGDSIDGGDFTFCENYDYDGGDFSAFSRYHHIYNLPTNPTIATDDVVITGIRVYDFTEQANTVLYGENGYILTIEKNPLIQSLADATQIANTVGAKLVGMRFRPMSLSCKSDPSIEAGDVGYVSTRKGVYQTLFPNVQYSVRQSTKIACDAESAARNSATRYSESTKAVVEARKNTERQLTAYDLLVQQMTTLICGGYGMFQTQVKDASGGIIYYMHDKPLMNDSSVRWFVTSEGMIEQNHIAGTWVTVSGTDKQGNALYNTLTARKVSADIIRTGKIYNNDGNVLIDMAYGVANEDNTSFSDNIQDGFPLRIKFKIGAKVSKINEIELDYYQEPFRTSSTTASSGGGSFQSSESGGGGSSTTDPSSSSIDTNTATQLIGLYGTSLTTNSSGGTTHTHTVNSHTHEVISSGHWHSINFEHVHGVDFPEHIHYVNTPPHTHGLDFGIQEQAITDYSFTVFIDGVARVSVTNSSENSQGTLDLAQWVTTSGWHTIEIRSTTLKRVSASVNIKSYIRS